MRPSGLTELTLMMCALNPTAFLFMDLWRAPRPVALTLTGLMVLLGYVVLWYFWNGRNWARLLVLVTSVLTLFNVLWLLNASPLQGAAIVMEIVLSGFLLYWLNTAGVRAFFVMGYGHPTAIALPGVVPQASPPPPSLIRRIGVPWIVLALVVCASAAGLAQVLAPGLPRQMLKGTGMGVLVTLAPYLLSRRKGRLAFGERSLLAGAVVGTVGGTPPALALGILLTVVALLRRPVAARAGSPGVGAPSSPWALRAALLVPLALVASLVWYAAGFAEPDRIDDRAGVLDPQQGDRFEKHLGRIRRESNVDMRFVLVDTAQRGSLDEVTARASRKHKVAGEQRRALFVLDPGRRQLQVVVGPALQGVFSDVFVGYLARHHIHSLAEAGDATLGLRLTLRLLQARIRQAALGEEYDPRPAKLIEERAARAALSEPEARRRFVPQRTVDAAFQRYLEWLFDGWRYGEVELFTAESRAHLARFPVTRGLAESDLLLEYGKRYDVLVREDLALLYFTDDPLAPPHFFRRSPAGWQMDILAGATHTREHVVGPLPWSLIERDDEVTRAFIDRYVVVDSALRVAGGDNRRLRTADVEGDEWADSVLIRMLAAVTPDSVRLPVNGAVATSRDARSIPELQQITVMEAAQRMAAGRGRPAVVLFYDVGVFMRLDAGGRRHYEAIFAALRRCQKGGATVLGFSTDVNPMLLHGLPDYLRDGNAPFPAISLYRWPRGQLTRALASIDIDIGAGWKFPVVLVLDRDGRVAMEVQDAFAWGTRNDLVRIEAILSDMRRREGRRLARAN